MYLQKVTSRKNCVKSMTNIAEFGSRIRIRIHPLVRGLDPRIRIRIHTKMSWIRNTVKKYMCSVILSLRALVMFEGGLMHAVNQD
jgi:hypothetical protein